MRALVWFRTDLRLSDNPALFHACRDQDEGVLAVFALTPKQWAEHDDAPIKVDFRLRNLRELSSSLAAKNIALKVIEAPTFNSLPAKLHALAKEHDCHALYFNEEYEVNERERDEHVADRFEDHGLEVHAFTDQGAFKPGELRTGKGDYYTVFSPFKRAWYAAYEDDPSRLEPLTTPRKLPEMVGSPDTIPESVKSFDPPEHSADLWPAGEKVAMGRLTAFLQHNLDDYKERRDFPDQDATSQLSPYLTSGVISIRRCYHAAIEANEGKHKKGSKGAVHWISELIWREFYKHLLVGHPRLSRHRAFQQKTEKLKWKDNDEHHEAWCAGRTGYPIVDAGMRQLNQFGWMHNRLRMITAMFYTKHLFLDWRRGERYFMQKLVDGDLAANNGGWQWSASTGTDAAPYFRIMNPYLQSKKFEPDGAFIREMVPELAQVDTKHIHDPSQMDKDAFVGIDYPAPIVEYKATREAAIQAFQNL